jgi:hypothetical protein
MNKSQAFKTLFPALLLASLCILLISSLAALDGNHTTGIVATPEYPRCALLATVAGFAAFALFKGTGGLKLALHKTSR